MGIIETIKMQERREGKLEGKLEGEARKNHDFVENLIEKFGFSDEQAASAAEVPIAFVKNVRKELSSKK